MIATFADIVLVAWAVALLATPLWQISMTFVTRCAGDPWLPTPDEWFAICCKLFVGCLLIGVATSNIVEQLL